MMDSLAYRNDAATVLRRLIRSLPTRRVVLGIATCDKGLPAIIMAVADKLSWVIAARIKRCPSSCNFLHCSRGDYKSRSVRKIASLCRPAMDFGLEPSCQSSHLEWLEGVDQSHAEQP